MKTQICKKCIFDSKIPSIVFDDEGVCNYCRQIESLIDEYKPGTNEAKINLNKIIEEIKIQGRGSKYDCVVGVSGGTDSSYLLFKACEWGLRPLAVHYDNTWNTSISANNISKITSHLNVDLYTYVVDHKEVDDIYLSFLKAGVPEFDACTDIAFVQVLRSAAAKYKIKYILEGHSFIAEGISPQGNNYFDGKYIADIHNKFGSIKMKSFPNMTLFQFMKWILVYRQKFIRPLWYLNYSKKDAREFLQKHSGWEYYGGHHLENRATSFLHTVYNPLKFDIDNRNWSLSAEVRAGLLDREAALKIYNEPIVVDNDLVSYVKKRLNITDIYYDEIMKGEKKSWTDYKTYKKWFQLMKPLFFILMKSNYVTKSFYQKYCF